MGKDNTKEEKNRIAKAEEQSAGRGTYSGSGSGAERSTLNGRGSGQISFSWNEPDTARETASGHTGNSGRKTLSERDTGVWDESDSGRKAGSGRRTMSGRDTGTWSEADSGRKAGSGRRTMSSRDTGTWSEADSGRKAGSGRRTMSGHETGVWDETESRNGSGAQSSRYDYDDWKTRVYRNDDLRAARKHTWIGTDEEAAEIEARKTRIMQGLDPWDGSRTDSYTDLMGSRTGRFTMTEIDPPLSEQKKAQEQDPEADAYDRDRVSFSERMRGAWRSLRSIRISDSRRFRRFLVLCAVFAVILALEISYFYVKPYVDRMPEEIAGVNKQVKELRAENKELKTETDNAGDFESKKELKESWERLRDKLKEQAEVTSSL